MTEAEAAPLVLDLSKKKKKKKAVDEPSVAEAAEEVGKVSLGGGEEPSAAAADADGAAAAEVPTGVDGGGDAANDEPEPVAEILVSGVPTVIDFSKKKKKKKKVVDFGETEELVSRAEQDTGGATGAVAGASWERSDRDYTYDELIDRAYQILLGKNDGVIVGGRKKFKSPPPQVKKEGKKKTVLLNYADICKGYRRQQEHLLAYLSAELGTSGALQSNGSLVIKGNFDEAGIENVLKRYIKEYVACSSCHSPDTVLIRNASSRLYFMQCESCGASRSVQSIRQGFMAQVGKRKHG